MNDNDNELTSNTKKAPIVSLKYAFVMLSNLSCPAVSHICAYNLIVLLLIIININNHL